MQQSRLESLAETAINTAIGYAIALGSQLVRSSYAGSIPTLEKALAKRREELASLTMVDIPRAEMALREARIAAGFGPTDG